MILPDVNLLVYAYDASATQHKAAASWWQRCLNGTEIVGLAPVVIFGFIRLVTHPRVFTNPLSVADSALHVQSWLVRPQTMVIEPCPHHISEVLALLQKAGTGGNLTADAQIAALALQEGATVHSNDTDFHRFSGLKWHNPLTGKSGVG